jgi:Leucine-rich repeat (LRR) protein
MLRNSVLLLAVAGGCGWASSRAGDAADVLGRCREACGNLPASTAVTLERDKGAWRIAEVSLFYSGIPDAATRNRDPDLQQLAALTALDSLHVEGQYGRYSCTVTVEGIKRLLALKHLRRLMPPPSLTGGGLEALCALPELEELELYRCEAIWDEDLVHLTNLASLRRLNLQNLKLTDAALPYMKPLKTLDELDLGETPVTDAGLAELKGLENLRVLVLGDRESITDAGLAELKGLRNLRKLDLRSNNRITDAGLAEIKGLKNLQELDLVSNHLITDAGLAQLKGLDNLRFLALGQAGEAGLSALKDLPRLERLSIGRYVPGARKADLSALGGLKWLTIGGIAGDKAGQVRLPENLERLGVSLEAVEKLSPQPSLRHLELVEVSLPLRLKSAVDLKWLSSLPALRELKLNGGTARAVSAIAGLASLRALTLTGGCGAAVNDEAMKDLAGLRQLESLKIDSSWGVTDAGMGALGHLTNLRRLELACSSPLTAEGLASIGDLRQLRALRLYLSGEALKGSGDGVLAHLKGLSELEELSFGGATMTDEGLKSLAGLKKLRRLRLAYSAGYTDDGLASLMKALPDLQVLKRTYEPLADQGKKRE